MTRSQQLDQRAWQVLRTLARQESPLGVGDLGAAAGLSAFAARRTLPQLCGPLSGMVAETRGVGGYPHYAITERGRRYLVESSGLIGMGVEDPSNPTSPVHAGIFLHTLLLAGGLLPQPAYPPARESGHERAE